MILVTMIKILKMRIQNYFVWQSSAVMLGGMYPN